jgi:long-chain-fatty-acid--CoA ligase ACSBG
MEFVKSFETEDLEVKFTPYGLSSLLQNFDPQMPQKNILWTTDPNIELPIIKRRHGDGSKDPITMMDLWKECIDLYGTENALAHKFNKENKWEFITYNEFYEMSRLFASSLIHHDISERSSVAILGGNHPAWLIGYHGAIFANCINVGLYFTSEASACQYILELAESEVVMVDSNEQLDKILQVWHKLPRLKYCLHWGPDYTKDKIPRDYQSTIYSFEEFLKFDKNHGLEAALQERMDKQGPGLCSTYVFTSGTTGHPKGVMLSHDNYTFLCTLVKELEILKDPSKRPRIISYLPLSHVAAQYQDVIFTLKSGACLYFTDENALKDTLLTY